MERLRTDTGTDIGTVTQSALEKGPKFGPTFSPEAGIEDSFTMTKNSNPSKPLGPWEGRPIARTPSFLGQGSGARKGAGGQSHSCGLPVLSQRSLQQFSSEKKHLSCQITQA